MKYFLNGRGKFLCIFTIVILLVCLYDSKASLDLQYHDTYYIFSYFHLAIIFIIVLVICKLIYRL